jgi:hypothetical protein
MFANSMTNQYRGLVRKGGFEPPRPCGRSHLKAVRLPISPLPLLNKLWRTSFSSTSSVFRVFWGGPQRLTCRLFVGDRSRETPPVRGNKVQIGSKDSTIGPATQYIGPFGQVIPIATRANVNNVASGILKSPAFSLVGQSRVPPLRYSHLRSITPMISTVAHDVISSWPWPSTARLELSSSALSRRRSKAGFVHSPASLLWPCGQLTCWRHNS